MADLSERLGLERAKDVSFRAAGSFQHAAACIEADRRATVEAVVRWLVATDAPAYAMAGNYIRRELLAPPSPGEGREPEPLSVRDRKHLDVGGSHGGFVQDLLDDDGTKIGDLCTVCDWYRIEGRTERESGRGRGEGGR